MKRNEDISMTVSPGVVLPIAGPGLHGKGKRRPLARLSKNLTKVIKSINGTSSN